MKYLSGGLLILALLICSLNLSAQVPDWDDTLITEISGTTLEKRISKRAHQIASDNTLHAIFYQNSDATWQLFYSHRDTEDNWSTPELIPAATTYMPDVSLILTPYQNDLKIYATSNNNLYELSRDDTETWVAQQISMGTTNIMNIDTVVDIQGNIHIVGITTNADAEPKLVYVTDISGEWTYDILYDAWLGPFGTGASPVIAVNDDGRVIIGYRGGTYGEYHIHIAQNDIAGVFDWSYEIVVSPNANDLECDLMIKDGVVHMAYSGQDGFGFPWSTYYVQRDFDGNAWSLPQLTSSNFSLLSPTLAVDPEGNIHLVMVEVDGNFMTGLIFYSTNVSGNWVVSNPFGEGVFEYPTLLLDHSGNFQLLKIVFSYDGGMQWEVFHRGASHTMTLPVPFNLQAEIDGFNVLLSWEAPDIPVEMPELILEGYNVWRRSSESEPFAQINDETITETAYLEINLMPGTYSYYVTALYTGEGESNQSNIVTVTIMEYLPPPEFTPEGGVFEGFVNVTIISPNEIGTIHYTLNGEDPTEESAVYHEPIYLEETTTVKARTYHPGWHPSVIVSAEYLIDPSNTDDDLFPSIESALYPARPNPFNPSTVISYSLQERTPVEISIYNIMGQKVRVLVNSIQEAGNHSILWDGRDDRGLSAPSGIYFYRMRTHKQNFHQKMLLLK